MSVSIIFPAFVNEYKGTGDRLNGEVVNTFQRLLESASRYLNTDLTGFDFYRNNFLEDEHKSQYISYIFSCSLADYLKGQQIRPSFVSGYSMGIYAALYYCGSVDFLPGLRMVKQAWEVICSVAEGGSFGMGLIIGLDEKDLLNLLRNSEGIEISNQNNPYTFILSGTQQAVEHILNKAREEGALRATLMPVSKPYHSAFLKNASPRFAGTISDIAFRAPEYPYVSAMDQNVILTGEGLRKDAILNLSRRMNWLKTMNGMLSKGTDLIFECGAGDGLTRNARFIEGKFQSFSVEKLEEFIASATGK